MTIDVERPGTDIALITINRPHRANALTFPMFAELTETLGVLGRTDGVRAIVITGAGRGFCAGVDLDEVTGLVALDDPDVLEVQERAGGLTAAIAELPVPVIAAVNGPAVGAGLAIALAADIRLAGPDARFCAAFIRIGFTGGDMGTSWLLPRIVGLGRALEMLLTGEFVDADAAERMGLVNRVVPAVELVDEAIGVAAAIAEHPPLSVRLTKEVVHLNVDAPSLHAAQQVENRNQVLTAGTPDMLEALAAFRQGRPPRYRAASST